MNGTRFGLQCDVCFIAKIEEDWSLFGITVSFALPVLVAYVVSLPIGGFVVWGWCLQSIVHIGASLCLRTADHLPCPPMKNGPRWCLASASCTCQVSAWRSAVSYLAEPMFAMDP